MQWFLTRGVDSPSRPWPSLGWLVVALLMVAVVVGCRRGVPVLDTGPRPAQAAGTISGTVRGPESPAAIRGRIVAITNLETNERHRVTTSSAGGFTMKVAPGTYRVELMLRSGESLATQPGTITVGPSDLDAHADFVIGTPAPARPRSPASRLDAGLGSPIA